MKKFFNKRIHITILLLILFVFLAICLLISCTRKSGSSPDITDSESEIPKGDLVTVIGDPKAFEELQQSRETPSESTGSSVITTDGSKIEIPVVVIEAPENTSLPAYDFSLPVPETARVEDDYFSDAVFIGDSRTDGFRLYSGLTTPTYLSAKSISVVNVCSQEVISAGNGNYVSILSALGWKTYSKVYVMLGINEIGLSPEAYEQHYTNLIHRIREIQPDATLYLQTLLPVSETKDNEHTLYSNERILMFNESIARLALENNAYYVDTYSSVVDENGFLPEEASYDGVHLTGDYCKQWCEYLRTHTVDPSRYAEPVPNIAPENVPEVPSESAESDAAPENAESGAEPENKN